MDHFTFDHLDNKPSGTIASPKPSKTLNASWVLARVKLLMASYRLDDYQNPEGFLATVATILAEYPQEIVEYVTDPRTGLQRRLKFPPSPAEVVEACAAEIGWRAKIAANSGLSVAPRLPPPMASGVVGDGGPGTVYTAKAFEEATKKHGRPTGPFERPGDDWSRRVPE